MVFAQEADHLLLTQIVTQGGPVSSPDAAESFSIYNPTNSPINLRDYYICDDENYYKMQTVGDMSPASHHGLGYPTVGFSARFPDRSIDPGDTLMIVLHENYSTFYGNNIVPDLMMFGNSENSLLPTDENGDSFGTQSNKIEEVAEMLILFSWNGTTESVIQDIDYFLWGDNQSAIDKSDIDGYNNDTPAADQLFFKNEAPEGSAYSRIASGEEKGEISTGGNGINKDDETSEDFRKSWEIIELFNMGCTDEAASNYDPDAEIDDENCEYLITIYDIQEDLDQYNGQEVTLKGVVTIGDDLLFPGKTKFYIQDNSGRGIQVYNSSELSATYNRGDYIEVTGEIEKYEDDVEITNPTITLLDTDNEIPEPHIMSGNESLTMNGTLAKVTGILTDYWHYEEGTTHFTKLTISNDDTDVDAMFWNSAVPASSLAEYELYENDVSFSFEIYGIITFYEGTPQFTCGYLEDVTVSEHEIVISEQLVFEVAPHPFIPSRGEKISYTYSVPNNFRCVIRIFDISGRFITTLYEGMPVFFDLPEKTETWDGRNQLNQLSPPGVYLIHLEATEVSSGKSYEEIAPIVIGVPVK